MQGGEEWSTWPSTGCDEPSPKPSEADAVHSPAEAPAALPFHSAGPPHLAPGAAAPPTTAATEDAYEGTWLEEEAAGRLAPLSCGSRSPASLPRHASPHLATSPLRARARTWSGATVSSCVSAIFFLSAAISAAAAWRSTCATAIARVYERWRRWWWE